MYLSSTATLRTASCGTAAFAQQLLIKGDFLDRRTDHGWWFYYLYRLQGTLYCTPTDVNEISGCPDQCYYAVDWRACPFEPTLEKPVITKHILTRPDLLWCILPQYFLFKYICSNMRDYFKCWWTNCWRVACVTFIGDKLTKLLLDQTLDGVIKLQTRYEKWMMGKLFIETDPRFLGAQTYKKITNFIMQP